MSQARRPVGWPRSFPIAQPPNAPLAVALAASVVGLLTDGLAHAYARAVGSLAFGVWAYLEAVDGVNWFRRLLGCAVGVAVIVRLALALR